MSDYPVIKFTLLFSLGILLQRLLNINNQVVYYFLAGTACIVFITLFRPNLKVSFTKQIFLFSLIVFFGMSTAIINRNKTKDLPKNIVHKYNTVTYGRIERIHLLQKDRLKFEILTDSILTSEVKAMGPYHLQCTIKIKDKKLLKFYNSIYPGYTLIIIRSIYIPRDKRNPGEFDYRKYLKTKNISGIINLNDLSQVKIISNKKYALSSVVFEIRKNIADKIESLYSTQSSALLKGLLLADRSNISYSTKEEFINAGVIHVLAVSGLHVGFISLIIIILLGRINLFVRSILTILALIIFLIITGSPPSVVRAVIMGTLIILSFMFIRGTNIFNSLALAALIILIIKPEQLFTPGFQLSFSAVWGIAVFYPIFKNVICNLNFQNKSIEYVLLFLGVSLGAQIGTLPFTLIYFGKLSLVALIINLIVIPLVGIIIATGIVSLFLGTFAASLAVYYASANKLFTGLMYWIISKTGNLSFSFVRISNFNYYDSLIIFGFIFFYLIIRKNLTSIFARTIIIFFIIVNIFLYASITKKDLLPENELSVFMIDVGQGDSFLIKFPNGKIGLVDAGIRTNNFDTGKYTIEPLLNYLNIDKIDFAFVSHIDIDHSGGFRYLINNRWINKIFKPYPDSLVEKDKRFERLIDSSHISKSYYAQAEIKVGNSRIYLMNKVKNKIVDHFSSNNKSGLFKIFYGNTSILFTGDLETQGEKYYSNYYRELLKSDILKVGHHGSSTSSSEEFLQYVKPKISMVSVGKYNRYKQPSGKIIKRLKNFNSKIYRTDLSGGILLRSDGVNINIVNWRD